MKKLRLFITMMFGAFLMLTTNVMAQSTASATGTATIISPLTITKTVDMNFGKVSAGASGGTVVLSTAGERTVTSTVQLAASTVVTAASFDVTGEGDYTYAITLPTEAYTITKGKETMTVTTFTSDPTPTGTLTGGSHGGTQTLLVGATLNVAADQAAGVYTNTTGFDVTVNYN